MTTKLSIPYKYLHLHSYTQIMSDIRNNNFEYIYCIIYIKEKNVLVQCKHELEAEKNRVMKADAAREEVQRKWTRQMDELRDVASKRQKELSLKLHHEQELANNLQKELILAQTKSDETSAQCNALREELHETLRAKQRANQVSVEAENSRIRLQEKLSHLTEDYAHKTARLEAKMEESQSNFRRAQSKLDETTRRAYAAERNMLQNESEVKSLRQTLSLTKLEKASATSDILELAGQLKQQQEYLRSLREKQMTLFGKRDAVEKHLNNLKGEKERVLMEMEMERRRANEARLKELSHSKLLLESIKLEADSFSKELYE